MPRLPSWLLLNKFRPLVVLAACLFALVNAESVWRRLEWHSYDLRIRILCGTGFPPRRSGNVVVAAIDETTALKKKPLIFWYPDLADFARQSAAAGVRAIGFDVIPYHSLGEKLAGAVEGIAGGLDRPLADVGEDLDRSIVRGFLSASEKVPIVQGVAGDLVPFFYTLMPFLGNVHPGSLLVAPDPDGVLRSQLPKDGKETETFVSALFRNHDGKRPALGRYLVDFRLLDQIPVIPFERVVEGAIPREELAGKTVLVGLISTHEDMHLTPVGFRPGVLVHAAALETALRGSAPVPASRPVVLSLLSALILAGFVLSARLAPVASLATAVLLGAGYFCLNLWLLDRGTLLPLFPHALTPLFAFAAVYPYRYLTGERARRRIYEAFGYYVDRRVIDDLIRKDARQIASGERREVCVLFLDIRDFTALSNHSSPESIVRLLNVVFSRWTEIIQDHQGFVNKFMGDGLLAFFAFSDTYVEDALRAARRILESVDDIDASGELAATLGDRPLAVGIGIHCGTVIVGNIGSRRKMDFTVIGPAVNLASRVEGLTKTLGRKVLVTEAVQRKAGRDVALERVGEVPVRGFAEAVTLYSFPEESPAPPAAK